MRLERKNLIKISIIVPIYNSQEFLKTCIESILNQSLKEIEIICIDDASTDDSYRIVKNYQKKYEYAKDINFDDILDCIVKMMEQRDPVVV